MIKLRTLLCLLCFGLLAACGGGGGDAPPPSSPPPAGGATAIVAVTVIDTQGRFVAGAAVTSPSGSGTSTASGVASLPVATGSEQLLRIEKAGFAEQVKPLTVPDGRSADALQVMLIERDAPVDIAAIEAGGSASGRDGVKVTFPAGALVNAAGNAVTGTIQLQMTPVDVTALDVGAFPGAFEGTPTGGARTAIMSHGTAELLPLQGGQKLNLGAGKTAEIELPLYAGKHQDGTSVALGDTIALWSLHASTGLWTQEGSGTVVASAASPSGMAMRATITHFSWWNIDAVSQRGSVTLTVNASGFNVPAGTTATVEGRVVAGTGPASVASTSVPVGQATQVNVPASATTRLSATFAFPGHKCFGTVDVSPAPGATVSAVINASCIEVPFPHIVNPGGPIATNSSRDVRVQVVLEGGQRADKAEVFAGNVLIQSFDLVEAQPFVTAFWNTSTFAEGTYTLRARATREGVVSDGNTVQVTVDRTPPQVVAVSPAPDVLVTRGTTFTIDFSEAAVTAAPFALTDAVKLSVLPLGQTAPVEIAATVGFDPDSSQQRVTVTPAAVLPFGTASVSWGGLRDAAGNAVTGQVSQSWRVSQVGLLGTGFVGPAVAAAMNGAGTVFTVGTRQSDGALVAMRGAGFVQVGPVLNDRALSGFSTDPAAIAIDSTGTPVVALLQAAANPNLKEVVIKRYDAGTDQWVQVGPITFTDAYFGSPVKLAIDNAGRPIVAYLSTTSLGVHVLRFDGTNWVDLGTLSNQIGGFTMTLDSAGLPVVALNRGFIHLFVQRYDGSTWLDLGTVDQVAPGNALPSPGLALDGADQPWLSWNRSGDEEVRLARFDGNAFVRVTVTPALRATTHALTFVQSDPVVAGFDGNGSVAIARLHNGVWEDPLAVPGGNSSIVLLPSGNTVTVVDRQSDGLGAMVLANFP